MENQTLLLKELNVRSVEIFMQELKENSEEHERYFEGPNKFKEMYHGAEKLAKELGLINLTFKKREVKRIEISHDLLRFCRSLKASKNYEEKGKKMLLNCLLKTYTFKNFP